MELSSEQRKLRGERNGLQGTLNRLQAKLEADPKCAENKKFKAEWERINRRIGEINESVPPDPPKRAWPEKIIIEPEPSEA